MFLIDRQMSQIHLLLTPSTSLGKAIVRDDLILHVERVRTCLFLCSIVEQPTNARPMQTRLWIYLSPKRKLFRKTSPSKPSVSKITTATRTPVPLCSHCGYPLAPYRSRACPRHISQYTPFIATSSSCDPVSPSSPLVHPLKMAP